MQSSSHQQSCVMRCDAMRSNAIWQLLHKFPSNGAPAIKFSNVPFFQFHVALIWPLVIVNLLATSDIGTKICTQRRMGTLWLGGGGRGGGVDLPEILHR